MATHRRRWARLADSVLREDWTRDQRSTFVGALCWFNQRRQRDGYTGRAARRASIPPGDLQTICLADSLEEARALLRQLQPRLELKIEERGRFTIVEWPNLSEFQEWDRPQNAPRPAPRTPGKRPENARSGSGSETGSDSGTGDEKDQEAEAPAIPLVPEQQPLMAAIPLVPTTEQLAHVAAANDATGAQEQVPPWGFICAQLSLDAHPPATPGERESWLDAVWPEILAAAETEGPDDTGPQRSARMKRIAHARWRVYRDGPRDGSDRRYRDCATRDELRRIADQKAAYEREAAERAKNPPPPRPTRIRTTIMGPTGDVLVRPGVRK